MPIDRKYIGKTYGPTVYTAGLEKMREFAFAVAGGVPSMGFSGSTPPADLNPVLYDTAAGAQSAYGSVIAFPTFCVTFAIAPFAMAVADPEFNINLLMLVHGEQEFEILDVIHPGDVLTTLGTVKDIFEKAAKDFLIVTTETKNQHGNVVVRGTWTAVIRHG